MSSAAQIHANQHNAQHSTGPISDSGKARSSQNAFRHGLASSQLLIPGESQHDFDALASGFFHDHKPVGTFECILVDRMSLSHWLMLRAVRLQAEAAADPEAAHLKTAVLMRYQISNERMFWKAFDTLRKLQKERAESDCTESDVRPASEPANGFVSQPAPAPQPAPAETTPPAPAQPLSMFRKRPELFLSPKPKRKRF